MGARQPGHGVEHEFGKLLDFFDLVMREVLLGNGRDHNTIVSLFGQLVDNAASAVGGELFENVLRFFFIERKTIDSGRC